MLGIILFILKLLFFIILVIFLLLILVILLILFVPIRYKAEIYYKDKFSISSNISYLFKILKFDISYKDNFLYEFKILGKVIFSNLEQNLNFSYEYNLEKTKKDDEFSKKKENREQVEKKEYDIKEKSVVEEVSINPDRIKKEKIIDCIENNDNKKTKKINFETNFFNKIKHIKNSIKKFLSDLILFKERLDLYNDFINDEINKSTFSYILSKTFKLLKYILPKKMSGYIKYGFDDPSTTGTLTSYLAIFCFMYQNDIRIIPIFDSGLDKTLVDVELDIKGRLSIYYIIYILVLLYFNKNIKYTYKEYKKLKRKKVNNVR